jgi:catechol 2,3-dioxygenase-like lactoylglutathione lyase family enzyme
VCPAEALPEAGSAPTWFARFSIGFGKHRQGGALAPRVREFARTTGGVTGIVRLHHVQVAAPPACEDAARAFYGGLLGLAELEKPPLLAIRGGCWFRVGTRELHIGVADPFQPAAKAHPALLADSPEALEELAKSLAAAGVEVRWADAAEIPGLHRFHVSDPWGNRLELVAGAGDTLR